MKNKCSLSFSIQWKVNCQNKHLMKLCTQTIHNTCIRNAKYTCICICTHYCSLSSFFTKIAVSFMHKFYYKWKSSHVSRSKIQYYNKFTLTRSSWVGNSREQFSQWQLVSTKSGSPSTGMCFPWESIVGFSSSSSTPRRSPTAKKQIRVIFLSSSE